MVPAPKGGVMSKQIITVSGKATQVFWTIKLLALISGEKTLGELSGKF